MYELEYWCPMLSRWYRVEGPDYDDLATAAAMASYYASTTGRIMRVVDWCGQGQYQTG